MAHPTEIPEPVRTGPREVPAPEETKTVRVITALQGIIRVIIALQALAALVRALDVLGQMAAVFRQAKAEQFLQKTFAFQRLYGGSPGKGYGKEA